MVWVRQGGGRHGGGYVRWYGWDRDGVGMKGGR